ncbi:MAG: hypothetical protein NTW87_07420 [Planctomycetota bacterium]|nr:hypothetical protein [Planctomycetota bacterium]
MAKSDREQTEQPKRSRMPSRGVLVYCVLGVACIAARFFIPEGKEAVGDEASAATWVKNLLTFIGVIFLLAGALKHSRDSARE